MKTLFLCGIVEDSCLQECLAKTKSFEFSANLFQKKMIEGFKEYGDNFSVLSAPFIGSYPNASFLKKFRGFQNVKESYQYVSFNNIWGIRNFSRARALKKAIRSFISLNDEEKLIVVYSPHTPFLEAAVYAKRKDPRIKICLVVPDLPQYMNLNAKVSLLYRIAKKIDIRRFNKLNRMVDSYMLLTEPMKEVLHVGNRPYFVAEGIVTDDELAEAEEKRAQYPKDPSVRTVVYTGKLCERFGVKQLVDEFVQSPDPTWRLVLCGSGELAGYIKEVGRRDARICYQGQVPPEIAKAWMYRADVLVNPRPNNGEYTKYSFPSKTIEYLLTGNPIVAYLLDGMPTVYGDLLYIPLDGINAAIAAALKRSVRCCETAPQRLVALRAENICEQIVRMANGESKS